MTLGANVRVGQVPVLRGLEVAVARGAALEGVRLDRPQRDEADATAGAVGAVAAAVERAGHVIAVGGAVVHARVEVGGEEGNQRQALGVLVALDRE